MRKTLAALLVFCLAVTLPAQKDDFKRERRGDEKKDAPKNALEGKTPPKLQVANWMNAPAGGLQLSKLKGKVVILDFWGVW